MKIRPKRGRPATVNAPHNVNVRLPDLDIFAMQRAARAAGCTFSELVRRAIRAFLADLS